MAPRFIGHIGATSGLAFAYAAAAVLGLSFATIHASASPVWAPTGIAIGALLVWGRRLWPGVFVGAAVANYLNGGHLASSLLIAVGNTLEAVAAVWLIDRLANGPKVFESPRSIALFTILAGLAAVISASIGVAALLAFRLAPLEAVAPIWLTWWLGDVTGGLLVAPLVVLWSRKRRLESGRLPELAGLTAVSLVMAIVVFTPVGRGIEGPPISFILIPPVAWAAFRFGARAAVTLATVASIFAVVGTATGSGPFATGSDNAALLLLQSFVGVLTLTALALAAVVEDRNAQAQLLRRANADLEERVLQRTQALAASEQRFVGFMQHLPGLAWIKDSQGKYRYANAGFAAIINRTPEQILGRDDAQLFPANVAAAYIANDRKVRETRATIQAVEVQPVNGELRRSLVSKFLIPGSEDLVGGVAVDVTEHQRLEAILKGVLDSSTDLMYVKDREGRYILVNQAFLQTLGQPIEKILGHDGSGWVPEDVRRRGRDHDRSVMETGAPDTREYSMTLQGAKRTYSALKVPFRDASGTIVGVLGVSRDISERKQAEETLAESLKRVDEAERVTKRGSWEWDVTADRAIWSEGMYRIFGVDSKAFLNSNENFLAMVHPDDRPRMLEAMGAALQKPGPFKQEYRLTRPDGHLRHFRGDGDVLPDVEGKAHKMFGKVQDITEELELEGARDQATRQAAEIERLAVMNDFKTRFINNAAHELSTPLTPIRLQVHLLKDRLKDSDHAHAVDILERNFTRLAGVVREVLDAARVQADHLVIKAKRIDLYELVSTVASTFNPQAEHREQKLVVEQHHTGAVMADPDRTTQVLVNLLSNATKFTPRQGTIRLTTRDEGGNVRIDIMDTGVGLTPTQAGQLFKPYSQVHEGSEWTLSGSGLGLYISKGIVENQGGTMAATSPGAGRGSTFTFTVTKA